MPRFYYFSRNSVEELWFGFNVRQVHLSTNDLYLKQGIWIQHSADYNLHMHTVKLYRGQDRKPREDIFIVVLHLEVITPRHARRIEPCQSGERESSECYGVWGMQSMSLS